MLKIIKRKSQNGQALLFVVVALTIALAVGISVSTRTLSSLKRVSSTDTSQRVIAAAEAGIERLLILSKESLDDLESANPDCSAIGGVAFGEGQCAIELPSTSTDNIKSIAIVDAEKFRLNDTNSYWFNLDPGDVREVKLVGFHSYDDNLPICWDNVNAAIYITYYYYDTHGDITTVKTGFYADGFANSSSVSGFSQVSSSRTGYAGCVSLSITRGGVRPYLLRIKTLYAPIKVAVFPGLAVSSGGVCTQCCAEPVCTKVWQPPVCRMVCNPTCRSVCDPPTFFVRCNPPVCRCGCIPLITAYFPYQGYKLISKGQLKVENEIKNSKTIEVYKTYPYAPGIFDYGVYTENALN